MRLVLGLLLARREDVQGPVQPLLRVKMRTASHPQSAFPRLVALVRSDRFKKHARTLNTVCGFARMSTSMDKTQTARGHASSWRRATSTTPRVGPHDGPPPRGLLHGGRRGRESTQSPHASLRPDRHDRVPARDPGGAQPVHQILPHRARDAPGNAGRESSSRPAARPAAAPGRTPPAVLRSPSCSTTTVPATTGTWWCTAARRHPVSPNAGTALLASD